MTTLIKLLLTIQFFYKMLFRENFKNPFSRIQSSGRPVYLLANGPSLTPFLKHIMDNGADKYDFFAVNAASVSQYFTLLKPRFYIMSDPAFFHETAVISKVRKAIDALADDVEWPMYLFVPYRYRSDEFINLYRKNKNITIIPFHSYLYQGLPALRNWIFSRGLGNGEYGSVILNAEYIALMLGYKELHLIGVEHSFFDGLCVNDDNIPCFNDPSFYGKGNQPRPIVWGIDDKRQYFSMSLYLEQKLKTFQGHEIMKDFADYMGARIINNTPGSLIDAYDRAPFM